jgi:hypothetical protein
MKQYVMENIRGLLKDEPPLCPVSLKNPRPNMPYAGEQGLIKSISLIHSAMIKSICLVHSAKGSLLLGRRLQTQPYIY